MQGRRPEIRKACIKNRLCIGDCTENHFQESVNTVLHCIEKWKSLLLIGKTKIHKQQLERLPLSLGLRSFKIDRSNQSTNQNLKFFLELMSTRGNREITLSSY